MEEVSMAWILGGIGLIVPGFALLAWGVYGEVVSRETRCRKCGFILTGISSVTRCPECGKDFIGVVSPYKRTKRSPRLGIASTGGVMLLLGLGLIVVGMV